MLPFLPILRQQHAVAAQEMVGAAGPLRNGDEVEFVLPAPLPGVASQKSKAGILAGGGHAVGAVRVQARIYISVMSSRVCSPRFASTRAAKQAGLPLKP